MKKKKNVYKQFNEVNLKSNSYKLIKVVKIKKKANKETNKKHLAYLILLAITINLLLLLSSKQAR